MFQSLLCMNAVFYACGMRSLCLSMKELSKGPICMHGTFMQCMNVYMPRRQDSCMHSLEGLNLIKPYCISPTERKLISTDFSENDVSLCVLNFIIF